MNDLSSTRPRPAGARRTGLRSRAVRTVGLAVFLGSTLVGGIAVILVQGAVTRSLDDTLASKAADVGAQLSERHLGNADPVQLPPLDPRDPVVVQVVGPGATLLAATPGVSTAARICAPSRNPSRFVKRDLSEPGLSGTFRILAVSTRDRGGAPVTICAARSDEQAELTRNLVLGVLAAAI